MTSLSGKTRKRKKVPKDDAAIVAAKRMYQYVLMASSLTSKHSVRPLDWRIQRADQIMGEALSFMNREHTELAREALMSDVPELPIFRYAPEAQ